MDTKKFFLRAIWIVNGLALLCLAGVVLAGILSRGPGSGPQVSIHTPLPAGKVTIGEIVPIHSTSRDPNSVVVRVELWIDGKLVEVDNSPDGASMYSTAQGWQPMEAGKHMILVRAINADNQTGQASLEVNAVETGAVAQDSLPAEEGFLAPPPGGFPSSEGNSQSVIPVSSEGDFSEAFSPPQSDPPQSDHGFGEGLLDIVVENRDQEREFNWVEFSAVSFEVNQDYEHIYMYAYLGDGPIHRYPAEQNDFFDTVGDRSWDIGEYLGGENSAWIPVPVNEPLQLFVEGWGWADGMSQYLGIIQTTHPPLEWDGRLILTESTGGDGFNLGYAIYDDPPLPAGFIPPLNLGQITLVGNEYIHWTWHGNPAEITGFKIYRDGARVGTVAPDMSKYALTFLPPCNEHVNYTITAYKGEFGIEQLETAHSNSMPVLGPACGAVDDIGTPQVVETLCTGGGVVIEVPYTYMSDHGDEVYVGAWIEEEDGVPAAAGHVRVVHGSGVARIELINMLPEIIGTSSIEVHLRDENGWYFYSEIKDLPLSWQEARPDFQISEAFIHEALAIVNIKNSGCASVDGFDLRIQPEEGAAFTERIDGYLAPGITVQYETFNPSLSQGYVATVDPDNIIPELDENNNTYEVGRIALKHIHIYRIEIHDASEGGLNGNKGEFRFLIWVNDLYTERPRGADSHWVLKKGTYDMDGILEPIILSPTLGWNQDLVIIIGGVEYDTGMNDFVGKAVAIHSHDMWQEDSWKAGGYHSVTSSSGHYTFYYMLEME